MEFLRPIDLNKCKLTDNYFNEALQIDVNNMLLLDEDRLLAGFRETAGVIVHMSAEELSRFMKGKTRYGGGWENGLIGGHTLGHYLTALAQAEVNPGLDEKTKKAVSERLSYMIDALYECKNLTVGTSYEGFLFGATLPSQAFRDCPVLQFDQVEKNKQNPFTEAWVPWYTMHKILSGLNAAFVYTGNAKALDTANSLGLWIARRCESWSEEVNKTVLSIEYGGMNDCLYALYNINKELKEKNSDLFCPEFERFKNAAHCFDETELFEQILSGKTDALNNIHANTTIPKFIGALARYETDNSEKIYLQYAESFWDTVVSKHTYVTGGNSEDEHFGRDNILAAERTNCNNETCNTYNMLKLSERLFAVTGKKKYTDYYERTLINAIMASQNHETGFTTYFQPMGTGYHKVFNTLDGNFWCCTGTGYENFTKLQHGIYYKAQGKLVIALYLASELETEDYRLIQDCDLTKSDEVRITVQVKDDKNPDDLYLRVPEWLKGEAEVKIGNELYAARNEGGFLIVPKEKLSHGKELSVRLPMGITCHNTADDKNTYAFCYGPYVLSARLGKAKMVTADHGIAVIVAAGKSVENDEITVTAEESVEDFIKNIDKYLLKQGDTLEFKLTGTDRSPVFTSHYNQYTESYGIYWKFFPKKR